jgi:CDP-diacylglycerol---glycerol-3-phosphate 3-phosphatidyltransferase
MNLPNKLTIARILLTPFFLAALLIDFNGHWLWACILFIVSSLTDMLDGKIARKYNLITDFGKFLDPLADKTLVVSCSIGFVAMGLCSPVVAIIIVIREFLISAVRMLAATSGRVIAANIWGKIKTAYTMVAMAASMFLMWLAEDCGVFAVDGVVTLCNAAMWIAAFITAMSGITYLTQNKDIMTSLKA